MSIYTDGQYGSNNPTWHEEDSGWKVELIKKMLDRNELTPQRVCEVGCGTGLVLASLQSCLGGEGEFVGYDISPQAIERACARQNDRLKFFCAEVTVDTGLQCDVLLLMDVIEHLQDYLGFLQMIKPMSQYILLHIPLDLSVQSIVRMQSILKQRAVVGHIHYFTRELALAALKDVGYTIIDEFYTGAAIDHPAQSLKSRLARFPRKLFFALSPHVAVRLLGGYSLMVLVKGPLQKSVPSSH